MLTAHVDSAREDALTDMVTDEINRIVDTDALVHRLLENTQFADVAEQQVRERFGEHPAESWRKAAKQLVANDIDGTDGLVAEIRALLIERLAR